MVGIKGKLDRPILHHRNAPLINKIGKAPKRLLGSCPTLGNDHRVFGIRQNIGGGLNTRLRRGNLNWLHAKRTVNLIAGARFTQNFARQADINRPLGHRGRNRISPVHHIRHLFGEFKFIFPFGGFTDHRGLIAHFLAPANRHGARAKAALFHHRRSARHQHNRHMFGCGIDGPNRTIGKPHIGMRHHRLRLAGRQIIAMRHAHRGIFMRHDQRMRKLDVLGGGFGQSFDDGRKIRTRIGKDIINPNRLHPGQHRPTGGQGNLASWLGCTRCRQCC